LPTEGLAEASRWKSSQTANCSPDVVGNKAMDAPAFTLIQCPGKLTTQQCHPDVEGLALSFQQIIPVCHIFGEPHTSKNPKSRVIKSMMTLRRGFCERIN
jgi:hypothetical protein